MVSACRQYLVDLIKSLGIPAVLTRKEELAKHQGQTYATVLAQEPRYERDGSRVARLENGYRRRLHKCTVPFEVSFMAKTQEQAESYKASLLVSLARRIDDGAGNAVTVRVVAGGYAEDGSVLAERSAARVTIEFDGGVYVDEAIGFFAPAETAMNLEGEIGL